MSEPTWAGEARTSGDVSTAEKPGVLHRVRLCYYCLGCGDYVVEWRESPGHPIDCPECRIELPAERFSELELLGLTCPICRTPMQHGQRHPEAFDVPEWANCPNCQYHWEFKHFY
mgnify:CR=1 FL=1